MTIKNSDFKKNIYKKVAEEKQTKNVKKNSGKKKRKKSNKKHFSLIKNEKAQKVIGLFFILISLFLLFSFISYLKLWFAGITDTDYINNISFSKLFQRSSTPIHNSMGKLGAIVSYLFIYKWFGISSFIFIFLFFVFGIKLIFKTKKLNLNKTSLYSVFYIIWISAFFAFIFQNNNELLIFGGIFGFELNNLLNSIIGTIGNGILIIFVLLVFLTIVYNIPFKWIKAAKDKKDKEKLNVIDDTKKTISSNQISTDIYNTNEYYVEDEDEENKETSVKNNNDNFLDKKNNGDDILTETLNPENNNVELTIVNTKEEKTVTNGDIKEHKTIDTEYDPTLDLPHYKLPKLDLLDDYGTGDYKVLNEELQENKIKIIETLKNYSIGIVNIKATIGPAVTLYEIIPAPGIRISKIKNLEDDIALSLSAIGIRIIAPIPGKGTIGIEVPNKNPKIVSIKSILSSEKFQNTKFELPIGLGKTIANESYIADLTKMPHLLIAGATGQGKSVGLNAIITSLLYKKHPAQLKFVLIDPKKVELSLFSKIERHFLAKLPDSEEAIITDIRKVVCTLNSLNIEMDSRYNLLKNAQVRNIKEYNIKFISRKLNPNEGHRFLPYIVIVVDEFADLIMTAGKEIETPLTRLAQLARAIGIHLIIATQRPSVNIITGTIKANFPARIAYRVISKIDSRTILDTGGADQLIGKGDMLLSTGSVLTRLQCAFVDTPEIDRVTDYVGSQKGYAQAFDLPEYLDENSEINKEFDANERDELFEDAARIIVQNQHGSTSLLQRKLKLGYNRAGRIIDQLEAAGIVGPFEGSKAREVRIANEMALDQFLKDLNM
ncbi:MAG: DNA translocase FtsK 4TM domain-containing protein [Bacteroidales bacterium]|nr:DNA translocase FtsK 4TM domain-containing protein [Bacteroidales bacterium]